MPYTVPTNPADQDEFTIDDNTWRFYTAYSGWLLLEDGVPVNPGQVFTMDDILLHGAGTHNHIVYSPNGDYIAAFADIGGTRYKHKNDTTWTYLPTSGDNTGRQIAGGVITDAGMIYMLAGNTGGQLQQLNVLTGELQILRSFLNVRGNSFTPGDVGARPRPVGWMLMYDEVKDLHYMALGDGFARFDRATNTLTRVPFLQGESVRTIGHTHHGIVQDPSSFMLGTRLMGMVEINDPSGAMTPTTINTGAVTRIEDIAIVNPANGSYLCACHDQGVGYYDGTTFTDITPAQSSGTGSNNQLTRWLSVAVTDVGGVKKAALGPVNPEGNFHWVYRAQNIETATSSDWDNATHIQVNLELGSEQNGPLNRLYGYQGQFGPNLVGTYAMAFDPSDPTGNTLLTTGALTLYRSTNFMATDNTNIAWSSYNPGLSMLSVTSVFIDDDGNALLSSADHNVYVIDGDDLLTGEPINVSVSGIPDGWAVSAIGSGASKVTLFAATSDIEPDDPQSDIFYSLGEAIPTSWTTTGYNASFTGHPNVGAGKAPRPGGLFPWDNGDGTRGLVGWADYIGYVRTEYNIAANTWSTWQEMSTGPTTGLLTSNINQERQIVGAADGSVMFGIQETNGQIWRSTDKGDNWVPIANSVGTNSEARAGRLTYLESTDTLAASDANGLYRIDNATTTANVTQITGISTGCILVADSTQRLYAHVRNFGACDLIRFDDFSTATDIADGDQIATEDYRTRAGDLAGAIAIGFDKAGVERGITGYQGAGLCTWTVPD